jgi:hypothetical protein
LDDRLRERIGLDRGKSAVHVAEYIVHTAVKKKDGIKSF